MKKKNYMVAGIAFSAGLGVTFRTIIGAIIQNIGLGIAIGIPIGVAIGIVIGPV